MLSYLNIEKQIQDNNINSIYLQWEIITTTFIDLRTCIDVYTQQRWLIHGLTHWGRVTHICVRKLATIGSDNGLSPGRRQAIIYTNAGILLTGPLRTNFNES